MSVRFIHAADLHIDSPLRGLDVYEDAPKEIIRSASRRALENLVELAIQEEVAFVLISGDLYDGAWKDFQTGIFVIRQLSLLGQAGIQTFIVSGNHDAESVITKALRHPQGVYVFPTRSPESVSLDGLLVTIHGQGYGKKAVTTDLSQNYPAPVAGHFNIGMLHTSLTGRPHHAPYAPCTVEGLQNRGYDYWALGHVHKHEIVHKDPYIVYPGNIQGRHVRETGPKGCTLVTVEEGQICDIQFQVLDVLRWFHLLVDLTDMLTGTASLNLVDQALRDALEEADGRPIAVRVELTGACGAHWEFFKDSHRWTNEIRAAGYNIDAEMVWVEKVKFNTLPPRSESLTSETLDSEGPLAEMIQSIDKNIQDDSVIQHFAHVLEPLRQKLPSQLTSGDENLDLTDAKFLREIAKDARNLLLARMLEIGGGP